MASNSGKDAVAESLNPQSSIAETVANQDTAAPNQTLLRAVVVDILYDLAVFPDEDIAEMKTLIDAPEMLETAPRNSIIARVITGGADKKAPEAREKPTTEEQEAAVEGSETIPEKEKVGEVGVLAYPFFPPHLCMPLKPGEQVWLVTDSSDIPSKVMYWMCRITEPDHVDDVNYTHGDRKFVGSTAPKTSKEKADAATGDTSAQEPAGESESGQAAGEESPFDINEDGLDDRIFGFPNGTGEGEGYTLKDEFAYEDIVNIAEAYKQFRCQDVPRYTKRPGDLVIQGSNNTLICLGETRGWTSADDPSSSVVSNATETDDQIDERKGSPHGAIDLVAGRGRYNWRVLEEEVKTEISEDPVPPTARVIMNSSSGTTGREPWVEVNKNPQETDNAEKNRKDNPAEGDPDYFVDAARIIVAHSSNIDEDFMISTPAQTIPSPIGETFGQLDLVNREEDDPSAVVAKADEIRIIARKMAADDPVPGAPEINGSIRLIKEGAANEDLAAIMLLPDGTIQISGSKIVIGRAGGDDGLAAGPGEGGSQPYIRYSDLETVWNDLMDTLKVILEAMRDNTTPGYGAPSPQLVAAAATQLGRVQGSLRKSIETVQSERIFGE
jgi:hypothetical protein